MYDFDEYLIKDIVHDQYDGADVNLIDFKNDSILFRFIF